jgi:hypothetical protein
MTMSKPCRSCKRAAICIGGFVKYFAPKKTRKGWTYLMVVRFQKFRHNQDDVVTIPNGCPVRKEYKKWEERYVRHVHPAIVRASAASSPPLVSGDRGTSTGSAR